MSEEQYTQDELNIARQFGHDPKEIYGERQAFADEDADLLGLEEDIAMGEEDLMVDEPMLEEEVEPVRDAETLKAELQTIIDNEESEKETVATAEELLARLEELSAAMQNAEDFLAENSAPVEEEVVEDLPAGDEEVVIEDIPAE